VPHLRVCLHPPVTVRSVDGDERSGVFLRAVDGEVAVGYVNLAVCFNKVDTSAGDTATGFPAYEVANV